MANEVTTLDYRGALIQTRHEMLSLTDMWRAAGSPANREPFNWARFEGKSFLEAVALSHNLSEAQVMVTKRGKGGATFAHWQGALGYAKYLDHDFHMWCNTVVRERMQGPPAPTIGLSDRDRSAIGGIVKAVVPALLAEALTVMLPALVREEVSSRQHAVVDGVSAGQVLGMAGVGKRKGSHGLAAWVSHRLRRFHAARDTAVRLGTLGSRSAYVFDPLISREWLAAGGKVEIESKLAEREGQGVLRLVPKSKDPKPS